ncbi:MAG: hypothetical protein PHN37_03065, partial [Candidatus Pacebacteria bacterium]|nr:hypothetical protein [Candidatus Paceibacterota bacterium]
ALVRIFNQDKSKEMFKRTTDKLGKYFCIVPPGEYTLVVQKKQEDESYSLILETKVKAQKGIINMDLGV